MADTTLVVKIGANLKEFNKGMAEVNKKIKGAFSPSELSRIATITATAGVALAGFAAAAVKTAGNYQQAATAFEKLIGNAAAAKTFTDQLTDFAYSTPFDYDGLMKNAQALYQVGVAGNQIIPMLTAFSDAAAGIGKGQAEIDTMTKAIVHMQSIGEADTRTFESINRVGIPAWKMLAKAMNTTEQAAKDAVEQHMVSASQATKILVDGMNDMYSGMMKLQETKTINGALANLKGNVEHTMLEIGRIISDRSGIIPAINEVSGAFDTFAKTVRDAGIYEAFVEIFGPGMVAIVTGLGVAITARAIPALAAMGSQMLATSGAANVLRGSLMSVAGAAATALGALAALVAYKASQGIEGFDIDYHPEGLSEDDEAAISSAKAAIQKAEAEEKAAKAAEAARAAQEAMTAAQKNGQAIANSGGAVSGGGGGRARGAGAGSGKTAAELESERRSEAMRAARDELSSFQQVQKAMRESMDLRKAYMTAAESEAYEMRTQHEDAVQQIRDRWQEFEVAFIGMSDEERNRTIENLDKMGAAYEVSAEGRLSLAAQTAADIAAEEKRYAQETMEYYIQCKDLMAERDEAFRMNSLEKLQAAMTQENAVRLNSFETQQNTMQRYYENWLEINKTTTDRVGGVILNSQGHFENFFTNVMTGAQSFGDSLLDLVNDILKEIMSSIAKMMASKIINSFLGMLFGGGGGGGGVLFQGSSGFNWNRSPFGWASGGYISGPGTSTSDSVPAWLSNGEFVMSSDAVSRLGVPFLNSLNRGQTPRFASGGAVGTMPAGSGAPPVIINLHNESGMALEAQETESGFDGESWVVGVVLNAVATNKGGMRTMLKGAMG